MKIAKDHISPRRQRRRQRLRSILKEESEGDPVPPSPLSGSSCCDSVAFEEALLWAKFPVMRTLRIESRRFVGVSLRVRYKEWVGGKGEAGELEWRRSKLGWFNSRGFFVRGILQLQQRRILVFLPLKSDMWCAGKEKMRLVFLKILDEVSGDCLCPGRNSRMKEE